jgi:hypothetical protein
MDAIKISHYGSWWRRGGFFFHRSSLLNCGVQLALSCERKCRLFKSQGAMSLVFSGPSGGRRGALVRHMVLLSNRG